MAKNLLLLSFFISLAAEWGGTALAQSVTLVVQAESGTLGSEIRRAEEGEIRYVTAAGNGAGQNPASAQRTVTYAVTFPQGGTYDLYARVRVGANGFDDDSFFYGNGFGIKSPTNDADWITANGLSPLGFTGATDMVTAAGTAGNSVWKWIKLSDFNGGDAPTTFVVPHGALTQAFSIGVREDGLDLDQFVFGLIGKTYTVADLGGGTTTPPTPASLPIAHGKSKFLGNVYSAAQVPNFADYWNQVVPENAGKWGSVESTRDVMNWTELDAAYALAKNNGFPFRMHVLVWGNQQPSWIETLSASEQLVEIEEWFSLVAERYSDIDFLEVVNEPLHDPPTTAGSGGGNYARALGGSGTSGWDWILTSFRLARKHFPRAKLMINEYNIVGSATNTNRYLQIINLLKAQNLIDAIGVQAHAFSTQGTSAVISANLNILGATDLPIYATEMDIDGPTDQVQLQNYQRIFPLFWEHPSVQGITLWGYRPGLWRQEQSAFLITANGIERPALTWLRTYVGNSVLTAVDQDEAFSAQVSIFPNPVINRSITISGAHRNSSVQVLDSKGRLVLTSIIPDASPTEMKLEVAPGLYILRISNGNKLFSRKMVVQ